MWLSNLRIVLPDGVLPCGSIQIEDGVIVGIVEGPAPVPGLSAPGLIALPGLIDIHGDMLEREIEPRPKANIPVDMALFELDKHLAGAGITTHYAAVAFHWLTATLLRSEERAREIINIVHELQPRLLTDIRIHARFEITNVAAGPVLTDLMHTNQVHLVSLMDHTPGQGQYRDIEHYIQTMIEWRQTRGGQVVEEDDMREHVRNLQARPKGWDIVEDVARIAAAYGLPLASHDDDTPEKVEYMEGCGTSISEFPVTLEAAQAAKARGMHVAMGAPNALRGQSTSNNLSAQDGIAAGLVDILATDYHPASMLHAAHELATRGVLPLHAAINLVSLNPAAALGLHDRGSLAVGKRADLSLVDMRDRPRVRATLRAGRQIYSDGTVCHA